MTACFTICLVAASASEWFRSYERERVDDLRSYTLQSLTLAATPNKSRRECRNQIKWTTGWTGFTGWILSRLGRCDVFFSIESNKRLHPRPSGPSCRKSGL